MKPFLAIILLYSCVVFSQKKVEKQLPVGKHISLITVELNQVYSVVLKSTKESTVSIKATSEGEYANSFVVANFEQENTLIVVGDVSFLFKEEQDKLGAHKVHAISLEITVPENFPVQFKSGAGTIKASGFYSNLAINQLSGYCFLTAVSGNIAVQTHSANIYVAAKSGTVYSETNAGYVRKEKLRKGKSVFRLKTLNGNINIVQTK